MAAPSEADATSAVDAAARAVYEQRRKSGPLPPWESLHALDRNEVREAVLPLVWAALEALGEWKPGRWWRVLEEDGSLWCETSNEAEARAAVVRENQTLERLWRREDEEWRTVE